MITPRTYSVIKHLTLIIIFIFLLWLLNLNFPRNRFQQISLDFFHDQTATTKIGPGDRIKRQDDLAVITDNLVYFDLRFLPWFDQVRIIMTYQPNSRNLEGLGYQTDYGFNFSVTKPISEKIIADGFYEAIFIFDLDKIYRQRNVTRFLISTKSDGQKENGDFKIKEIKINLLR